MSPVHRTDYVDWIDIAEEYPTIGTLAELIGWGTNSRPASAMSIVSRQIELRLRFNEECGKTVQQPFICTFLNNRLNDLDRVSNHFLNVSQSKKS